VTGEIAEFTAARLLGLERSSARNPGYDATKVVEGRAKKLQIKGRCVPEKFYGGQRVSRLSDNADCDFVLLVLLNEDLEYPGFMKLDGKMSMRP